MYASPSSSLIILYCVPDWVTWLLLFLKQKKGNGRFVIAAIQRTDFLPGACIWVLHSQAVGSGGKRFEVVSRDRLCVANNSGDT